MARVNAYAPGFKNHKFTRTIEKIEKIEKCNPAKNSLEMWNEMKMI